MDYNKSRINCLNKYTTNLCINTNFTYNKKQNIVRRKKTRGRAFESYLRKSMKVATFEVRLNFRKIPKLRIIYIRVRMCMCVRVVCSVHTQKI